MISISTQLLEAFSKLKHNPYFKKLGKDWSLAIIFFVIGGIIALIFYKKIGYTFFYQNFIPEAILWACGHDFLFPRNTIAELIPFLKGQVHNFNCANLPVLDLHNVTGEFATIQPYLTWSVANLWKWFGVNYQALNPLIFALWGAYTSGIYLLFRQFCNKWVSILATLFISFSPVMVHMIGSLRDFSKAPFIIWALFLLIKTIKQPNKNSLKVYIPALAAGAIAGFGMGFRSDLFFLLPIGALFLFIGFSNLRIKTIIGQILSRAIIALIFSLTFLIFASPILKNTGPGGIGGVFIMQGMSEPFRENLKLEPASYTTGWAYSDELTLSSIAASERLNAPEDWDQREMGGIQGVTSSQTILLGTSHLFRWADIFIGDFTNQSAKSLTWVLGFPIYITKSHFVFISPFNQLTPQSAIDVLYRKLGAPLFLTVIVIGLVLLLFQSYLVSVSEFFAIAFLFLFLGAYPAIQFDFRHFFYLEFIWILCLAYFCRLPSLLPKNEPRLGKFLIKGIICISIFFSAYCGISLYQKRTLSIEVYRLLNLPREEIVIEKASSNSQTILITIPIPPEHDQLINSKNDSMTSEIEFRGTEWDVRSAATRYLITISGVGCDTKEFKISTIYKKSSDVWQPLSSTFKLNKSDAHEKTGLLIPGFYRPTQYLSKLQVTPNNSACNIKIEKIEGKSRLPFLFSAIIKNERLIDPLIKGYGSLSGH